MNHQKFRTWTSALVAVTVGVGIGVMAQRVRAAGAPSTTPLFYAGTLVENGVFVEGTRKIEIFIWPDEDTSGQTPLCTTTANATPVVAGRFRVALASECRTAVETDPDAWVEVVVADKSLGVAKIGALPYAIEADRSQKAETATGALETRLSGIEAAFNVQTRSNSATGIPNISASVSCVAGEKLIGGGCVVENFGGGDSRELALQQNGPSSAATWLCTIGSSGLGSGASRTLTAHAYCLKPPP